MKSVKWTIKYQVRGGNVKGKKRDVVISWKHDEDL